MKVFTREVQDKIQAASEAVIAAAAADGVKLQNFSMGCSVVDHTWVACSAYALPDEHGAGASTQINVPLPTLQAAKAPKS